MTKVNKSTRFFYISKGDFKDSETPEEGVWHNSKGLFIKIRSISLSTTKLYIKTTTDSKIKPFSRVFDNGFIIFKFGEFWDKKVYPLAKNEYLVTVDEFIKEIDYTRIMI